MLSDMGILERVSRALCLQCGIDPDGKFKSSDWGPGTAPHEYAWHEFQPQARVAIRAVHDGIDESGFVDGVRYTIEENGSDKATIIGTAIDDVLELLSEAIGETS